MELMHNIKIRTMVIFTLLCLIATIVTDKNVDASTSEKGSDTSDLLSFVHDTISYEDYLKTYENEKSPASEIVIDASNVTSVTDEFELLKSYNGYEGNIVISKESGSLTYEFHVDEAGLYNIQFDYYPLEGKGSEIEREVYINGVIPYRGASYIEFYRTWKSKTDIVQDSRENDIRPKQIEDPMWSQSYAMDSERFEENALKFYFKKGSNSITLVSTKEPMAIGNITLKQEEILPTYHEYINNMKNMGAKEVKLDEARKVQGEHTLNTSNSTIYPISDRTSPLTEPYSPSKIRLNMTGGTNWQFAGQWISYEVEVPEDGLYELAVKYRQNIKSGVTIVRSLEIDGKTPFEEANELFFYYKNDWQITTLGNEEEDYHFYLTKGVHNIRFEVTLGSEMADILRKTDESILNLNKAYRNMLMVIGSAPDTMRDYQLDKKTPEAIALIEEEYYKVEELYNRVNAYSKGTKGSQVAIFDKLMNQLKMMYTKPDTIAKQWAAFKDNISALGAWSLSMKEQPLEIDYILVQEPDKELPKVKAGFIAKILHEIRSFMASFVEDYDSIGEVYEGEALEVWLLASGGTTATGGSGRDQAQVIKTLVDNYFIPESNIPVNVKLVNSGILLSSTLAGRGPDIAINVAGKEPVNYALRNAVVDLTQFDDYEEVITQFSPEALESVSLAGGVYALPQTMSFHVMFYRADILKELGLSIPQTWDEYYECLAVLQKNNMNVGITPDYTTFAMFLYQNGGEYYKENGITSALDSENAIKAFKQWTSNYSNYKMPVTFDFANRFRTGEMPLAIGDYTNYNYLSVFAPEIKGLWGFTTVPGIEQEDGYIDKSVSAWVNTSIILSTSKQQDKSWEFLKWWVGEETQTNYGNEIENILGVAGRVASANLETLEQLPWTNRDFTQLKEQLKYVKGLPEVPGGYFTERHITNAFYGVYNNLEDPREILEDYVKIINHEISNKRKEFKLPVEE